MASLIEQIKEVEKMTEYKAIKRASGIDWIYREYQAVSNCCSASIIDQDVCADCKEHCDVVFLDDEGNEMNISDPFEDNTNN